MAFPINDLAKILLDDQDDYGFGEQKDSAESGILVELPETLNYFGFWSFAFENSFMAKDTLDKLLKHYKSLVGKRVYWTALSEKGNILSDDKKRYAFVKLTSLIAADEPESKAYNIHSDGAGAFKA